MTTVRTYRSAPGVARRRRRGFTLLELLVGTVLSAFVGLAVIRLVSSQSRFYERQNAMRSSRAVARSALTLLQSELRMVETTGGVVSASSSRVVLRVPYAVGIVCGAAGGATVVSILPVDSLQLASAAFSGYAWRDSAGAYTYVEQDARVSIGASSTPCTDASVTAVTGGQLIALSPRLPATARPGTPVLLEQQIAYEFRRSAEVPGSVGLWRTPLASGVAEELAAPFGASARFGFYVLDGRTATATVPVSLADIRGLDLWLHGVSELAVGGRAEVSRLQTGIFFRNRIS